MRLFYKQSKRSLHHKYILLAGVIALFLGCYVLSRVSNYTSTRTHATGINNALVSRREHILASSFSQLQEQHVKCPAIHMRTIHRYQNIIVGCSMRQAPNILEKFLISLERQQSCNIVDIEFVFVNDNVDNSSLAVLERFSRTSSHVVTILQAGIIIII